MENCNETIMKIQDDVACQSEARLIHYEISYDTHAMSPTEWADGYVGRLYFVGHRNYDADKYPYNTEVGDYRNADFFMEALKRELPKGSIIQPVYMYSHSVDTISRVPYSCPWDSGWVGVFVLDANEVKQALGWKRMSKERWKIALEMADTTFEHWKAYCEGEVYTVEEVWEENDDLWTECILQCYGQNALEEDLRSEINLRWGELIDPTIVKVIGDYDFQY